VEEEFDEVYPCGPKESRGGFQKLLDIWLDKP